LEPNGGGVSVILGFQIWFHIYKKWGMSVPEKAVKACSKNVFKDTSRRQGLLYISIVFIL